MKIPYFLSLPSLWKKYLGGNANIWDFLKFLYNTPKEQCLYLLRRRYLKEIMLILGDNVSIISSNCFGGHFYQDLNIGYNSPTAGLFFFDDDYAEFVLHFEDYVKRQIEIIPVSKWDIANQKMTTRDHIYPIGRFKGTDVEIHFLHYHTAQEALEKWYRRVDRINYENIIFLGFAQNLPTDYTASKLLSIPHKKIFLFSTKKQPYSNCIYVDKFSRFSITPNPYAKVNVYYRYLAKTLKSKKYV